MLETLVTSKTRIKLILKFFLNDSSSSYLRSLESEFGESSNAIRIELNRFEKAGLLHSFTRGNRKYYQANNSHPLFRDIHNIVLKYVGIDQIVEKVVHKLGDLERVYLTGGYAKGNDNGIIDLIFVGKKMDTAYLLRLVEKAEGLIKRKIRYMVMGEKEFEVYATKVNSEEVLLLWEGSDHGITGTRDQVK